MKGFWRCFGGVLLTAVVASVLATAGGAGTAHAAYPTKVIDLIVPFAPGSSGDIAARTLAAIASKAAQQRVNVVNKPGASGVTGTLEALGARPDGYTLLMMSGTTSSIMAATRKDMPFKLEDRTYIARVFAEDWYFLTNLKTGWQALKEAVESAKTQPGQFAWAAAAFGSQPMFAQLDLFEAAGVDVSKTKMVVFEKGNAPAMQSVAEGSTIFGAGGAADVANMLATGRVKVLAVTAPERTAEWPDVRTTAEAGYPQADRMGWHGLCGPKGLPQEVVKFWADLVLRASRDPEATQMAAKMKKAWRPMGPEEFRKFVFAEYEQVLPLATKMGIRK